MAKSTILTIHEIEAFTDRLRATVEAAQESENLKASIARLISRELGGLPKLNGSVKRPPATRGAVGRPARVSEDTVLEILERAGRTVGMRELEEELEQHPETIRLKLRNLRQQGKVKTTGPRNQLRYYASGVDISADEGHDDDDAKGGRRRRGAATPARGTRARAVTRGRARLSPEELGSELLRLVQGAGTSGIQMSALSSAVKSDPKTIRKSLDALRERGSIRVSGHRRSTTYYPANG